METLLAVAIGILFGSGLYLMLRRSLIKIVLGLGLVSNAANLLLFTSAGLRRGIPPIVPPGSEVLSTAAADPLPQALILTAIVITFGVQAFALVLVYRAFLATKSEDPDAFTLTDEPDAEVET
jgi:multicomponent Na+:H+ antiporter subunit C